MAFATIKLKSKNGETREAPVGFSWTTFFAGPFVPLTRGDWKWSLIMLVGSILTFGIVGIIFSFIYNKLYLEVLLTQGYKVESYIGDKKSIEAAAQIKLTNVSRKFQISKETSTKPKINTPLKSKIKKRDVTDDLEELTSLYESGTLSEIQFQKAKNKLLK